MIRNLMATIEVIEYEEVIREYTERFLNEEKLNEYLKSNNNNDWGKTYRLAEAIELDEADLDQYIIDEIEKYNDRVIKIHKIGDKQIVEYNMNYEEESEIIFKCYQNYERINNHIYNSLDEALLGMLIAKNLEVNESSYAFESIKRMIKWN